MIGKLYVVATPIGNLSDMTFRAVEILGGVDFIAAEDTRVSSKLLNHFNIKKPMVSYHQHNTEFSGENIVSKILAGQSCGIITDAGMPCISDPGEELVKACVKSGIEIIVVPGASAVVSALAISGLPTSRFSFEGFLSVNKKQRYRHLEQVKNTANTLIFYEAPHKLISTLEDFLEYLGDRDISLCRELTKIHEEVIRTTITGALDLYKEKSPRGEYVLVVAGADVNIDLVQMTIEEALSKVQELVDSGMRRTEACREVAKETKFAKSDLYRVAPDGGCPPTF